MSDMANLAILCDGSRTEVPGEIRDGRLFIDPMSLETATGWTLKAQGLCKGDTCVPVGNPAALVKEKQIDLEAFAKALHLPIAVDATCAAAAIGESAANRSAVIQSLVAPDFRLPDLDGRMHSLSEHRGKKVLLVAHSSW